MQQAWDLQKGGATQREISKELEISLGKVNKLLKKARKVEMP
jgi:DNA-binding transcriptional regulator LsrR (DeoR family)